MNKQTIIFVGRSGAGKGVQSKLLQEFFQKEMPQTKLLYIETGQHFRKYVQGAGYTWDRARVTNDRGGRQPDFLAVWVWATLFVESLQGDESIIFDGTPRSLGEAHMLHTALSFYEYKKPIVVFLDVSRDEAEKRLIGRGRADDLNPEAIARRFAWYDNDVVPAIDFYRTDPMYHFLSTNGEQAPEKVHADIVAHLKANN